MLIDPISAVVFFSAVGISGLLCTRDDQILAAVERLRSSKPEVHRIVIDYEPKQISASEMNLS